MQNCRTASDVLKSVPEICRHGVKRQKCPHDRVPFDRRIIRLTCNGDDLELSLLDDVYTFHSKLQRVCDNCFGKVIRGEYVPKRKELFIHIFGYRPPPLNQEWALWTWEIQASVDSRRNNCREAVMTVLLFIQPGNPTRSRDVMTMIARRVWETRFNEEWEK